eukprot:CAMPEP_0170297058 /NCGR_PEP_ID=MMETSP0116_2-20130129/48689_1 /TAXON_ID=400756 /ORGANISM="Durinskia baltica, Strain CSIRO CS-38" /LENGTH=291 /DNA_ID=CAMNT_0010548681 /DNA_START=14 /DNA_END=887 /DNA_ORIENTATION=+
MAERPGAPPTGCGMAQLWKYRMWGSGSRTAKYFPNFSSDGTAARHHSRSVVRKKTRSPVFAPFGSRTINTGGTTVKVCPGRMPAGTLTLITAPSSRLNLMGSPGLKPGGTSISNSGDGLTDTAGSGPASRRGAAGSQGTVRAMRRDDLAGLVVLGQLGDELARRQSQGLELPLVVARAPAGFLAFDYDGVVHEVAHEVLAAQQRRGCIALGVLVDLRPIFFLRARADGRVALGQHDVRASSGPLLQDLAAAQHGHVRKEHDGLAIAVWPQRTRKRKRRRAKGPRNGWRLAA